MKSITVRAERGILLDAILGAEFGAVVGRRLLAETLELNPGLAAFGALVPYGTVLILPNKPSTAAPIRPVVSLFG